MKYSEFKRRIEELGFEIADGEKHLIIANEGGELAWISKDYVSLMGNSASVMLSPETRTNLLEIMFDYAKTPIHDRRDEKKYLIYPVKTLNYNLVRFDHTFRHCGYEDEDSFGIFSPPLLSYRDVSMVFSELEAKEICDYFGWDFNKVVVEADDEE